MSILKLDKSRNSLCFIGNPAQDEFIHNHAPHTLFAGGTGAGKTVAAAYKAILLSRLFPNNLGLVGRKNFPALRDTTMKTIQMLLNELQWKYDYKKQQQDFVFPNGSVIMFRYLDGFQPRQGLELGWFFCDQIEEIAEEVFNVLMTRLRRQSTPTKEPQFRVLVENFAEAWQNCTFHTANMTPEDIWIYPRWKVNEERKKTGHPEYNPRYYLVEAPTDVNKENLPDTYFDFLKDMPKDMQARYRDGIWGGRSGKLVGDLWKDEIHMIDIKQATFPDNAEHYRGYDHGGLADDAVCVYGYISPNPYDGVLEWIIYDEYVGEKLGIDEHARNINKIYSSTNFVLTLADPQVKHRTQNRIVGNRHEIKSIMQVYAESGLILTPAYRPYWPGITKMRRIFTINPGRPHRFLKDENDKPRMGAPRIYITQNCFTVIEQIKHVHMSEKTPGAVAQSKDDAFDGTRFLVASPINYMGGGVVDEDISFNDAMEKALYEESQNREEYAEVGAADPLTGFFQPDD